MLLVYASPNVTYFLSNGSHFGYWSFVWKTKRPYLMEGPNLKPGQCGLCGLCGCGLCGLWSDNADYVAVDYVDYGQMSIIHRL